MNISDPLFVAGISLYILLTMIHTQSVTVRWVTRVPFNQWYWRGCFFVLHVFTISAILVASTFTAIVGPP